MIELPPEIEEKIIDTVRTDYLASQQARDDKDFGVTAKGEKLDFDRWFTELKDLYNSKREPKTVPWKFCSNRSLRIATSILDTIHARLLPAIVNDELLRWKSEDFKDTPKLERIEKLMRYWIWKRVGMADFLDVWLKLTAGFGDCLTETTWQIDPIDTGETVRQPITDEQGNPQFEQSGEPAVVTFKDIQLNERSQSHAFLKNQVYLQKGSKNIYQEPVIFTEEFYFRELEELEVQGKLKNVSNLLKERMASQIDVDVSLSDEAAQAIRDMKLRNERVEIYTEYMKMDVDSDGFPEDIRVVVSLKHKVFLGAVLVKELTKTGRRPIHFQKFDNRLDRPNENDGEGILEKVKELASEIDAIFNQLTDANTLSILKPGFFDPGGDLDPPNLKLAPNRMMPVTDPQKNILFPDMRVQIDQLIAAIRMVLEFIERLTAASAFVFGKEGEFAGGSGTATRTAAIMQSADVRFQRPAERLRKGATEIIKQHLDLLQLNIPPGLETRILGEKGEPIFEANELTQQGVAGEYDAYMLADPTLGSKQTERELSQMFYSLLMPNPLVGTDPLKIYRVTADLLKAWDKNPEEILGPAPSPDDIDDPEDENTLIIQGDFARVRSNIVENHLLHIQKHQELLQSPSLAQIPPVLMEQIVLYTQQHIQEHMGHMQLVMALQQQAVGGKGGGEKPGDSGRTEGTPQPSGVEQAPGPLGAALDRQRTGESGTSQNQPV